MVIWKFWCWGAGIIIHTSESTDFEIGTEKLFPGERLGRERERSERERKRRKSRRKKPGTVRLYRAKHKLRTPIRLHFPLLHCYSLSSSVFFASLKSILNTQVRIFWGFQVFSTVLHDLRHHVHFTVLGWICLEILGNCSNPKYDLLQQVR